MLYKSKSFYDLSQFIFRDWGYESLQSVIEQMLSHAFFMHLIPLSVIILNSSEIFLKIFFSNKLWVNAISFFLFFFQLLGIFFKIYRPRIQLYILKQFIFHSVHHLNFLYFENHTLSSVVSDSVWPHRRQPTRLPCPWDSPGKNTGVGCHFLLQCRKVKSESEVTQSCPILSDSMDCSPPGSSIHGIFQARVLEWGPIHAPYNVLNWIRMNKHFFGSLPKYLVKNPNYKLLLITSILNGSSIDYINSLNNFFLENILEYIRQLCKW